MSIQSIRLNNHNKVFNNNGFIHAMNVNMVTDSVSKYRLGHTGDFKDFIFILYFCPY